MSNVGSELNHLLSTRLGERVRNQVMPRLADGVTALSAFDAAAFGLAAKVAAEHAGIRLGLTDATRSLSNAQPHPRPHPD